MDSFVFSGASPSDVVADADRLSGVYHDTGVLCFPGIFKDDPTFLAYLRDLETLTATLLNEFQPGKADGLDLADMITALAAADRPTVGKLFDLGTRPAKLLSAMQLKLHPVLRELTAAVFGEDAIIATPSQSDTLHIFPPGKENWRFNSPLHQDYPYLLQSPRQITFWVNFGRHISDVGGVTFWPGSQKKGIRPQATADRGTLVAQIDDAELATYPKHDHHADVGDLLVMNSLMLHRSIYNETNSGSRIVQLFRYSDLNDPQATKMRWGSAEFLNGGKAFETAHPELVVAS